MVYDIVVMVITPLKEMVSNYLMSNVWQEKLGISIVGVIGAFMLLYWSIKVILNISFDKDINISPETNKVKVGKPISDADYINKAIDEDWY